jgi:hypothetical protein
MDGRTESPRQRWRTMGRVVNDTGLNPTKAHPSDGRDVGADCPVRSLMERVLAFMDRYEERQDCFRA